jgi:hypothetical protein
MDFFAATVSGVPLVSGLEWRTLTGLVAPTKEIVETARDIGAKLYVETRNTIDVTCGFLPDERRADLPKKALSLAALLAAMPNIAADCVLVVQENEVAVLAALRDGMPAPGFDGYGPLDEMVEAAQRFIQLSPNGATVYGNCAELNPVSLTLEEIVTKSNGLKLARIRPVPRPWIKHTLMLTMLGLVSGGAYFAYDHYATQKRLEAERLAYVDVEGVYANSVKELFKAATPVKQAVLQIEAMLANTPMYSGGWALAEIACQRDGCSYVWRNEFGTNRTFVPPEGALKLTYSNKGDAISYQKAHPKPLVTGVDISKPLNLDQVLRDVIGDLQEFQQFEVTQNFDAPAIDFGVPPELPSPPAKPFKEGAFTLGGPIYALEAAQKLPDMATLETLRITIADQQLTFNISGKYYVK